LCYGKYHYPLDLFVKFKDLHGEAMAREYFEVYNASLARLNEEVGKEVVQKKMKLRSELLNELVTKHEFQAEIKVVRAELNEFKAEVRAEFKVLKFTMYTMIALMIVFIGTSNPTFVELVKAILR
jgi:hypothetical protein